MISKEDIENLTLLLIYLTSWDENYKKEYDEKPILRAWKNYSFEIIDSLKEKDLISGSMKAKSVYITDKGIKKAKELLNNFFPDSGKITDSESELLDVVDRNDKVIGQATRKDCHEKGLLHRISIAIIFDKNYRIFVGKRSKTKYYRPGEWSISVGGHVESGETYEQAMKRELKEEIGIDGKLISVENYVDTSEYDKECRRVFYIVTDQKIRLNEKEYEEGLFLTYDELKQKLKKDVFVPSSDREFRILTILRQKGIIN